MAAYQRQQRERNDSTDRQLREALAAHAKGSIDVIIAIASERNVQWADALASYPEIFEQAAQALLDRVANAKGRR